MFGERIDLHMHSCFSDDGEFTPTELVNMCHKAGIKMMAISDHNSVQANIEGMQAAKALGIQYIPAIEIDCTYEMVNLHVLGYGIDFHHPDFADIEANVHRQSVEASKQMLIKTQNLGFHISEEELMALGKEHMDASVWTGEMFAEVLLNKPEYRDHPLLAPYRQEGNRGDNPYVNFYWDYYAQGKECYVEMVYPSLTQVIEIIHRHGGYAVLAHPAMNLKKHHELLVPMIACGLDGIEAFSNYHSKEETKIFYDIAQEHHLFVTCGSDFHGKTKPSIGLGKHGCFLDEEAFISQLKPLWK